MKKYIAIPIGIVLTFLFFLGCKKNEREGKSTAPEAAEAVATPSPPRPPAGIAGTPPFAGGRKTSFQEVTAQLDPGGSLFLYLATDQWLAGLTTNISQIRELALSLPGPGNHDAIGRALDSVGQLIKNSGVEDITGVGASAVPVAPGLYRNKFIVHHPSGAGQGFLWSIFGRAPHALGGQSMLPTNTALAAFGDVEVRQLWQVLERELLQSGIPDAQEMIRAWPKHFEARTQIPWTEMLASFGGEVGLILTLDGTNPVDLPMGRSRINIPAPGLLLAVKVHNSLLYDRLSAQLQSNPKTTTVEEGGLKICSMPVPAQIPIPLELTVASSGDYVFFATSPELVRTVQAVRQGQKPGLKSSAEFQNLARHLPAEGNQFIYVARSFGETFAELQEQAISEGGMPPEQRELIRRLFAGAISSYSLSVGAHTATGWQSTSIGNRDSASTALLAPTVGVTAVGAGLLLPALAKAKAKAQNISTVNNLKQLGLAARLYSNDRQEKFPKAETWCDDLKPYVGSTKIYKAPNDPSPGPSSFAYNAKLSGMSETRINPQTVLFFETDNGEWNQSGGPEMLPARPRSGGVYVIGLADGSVQMIQASRINSLRWDP